MANPPRSGDQALLQAYDDDEEGFRVVVSAGVDLDAGDIQIGAVELKDGATDTRAKIAAGNAIVVGDNALAVSDPATEAAIAALQATVDDGVAVTGPLTDAALRATPVPVSLAADEDRIGAVGGLIAQLGVEVTRPAGNATPYTAKDVVGDGTVIDFGALARVNGGTGYITKARIMTDKNDVTPRLRLHLFHTAPAAIADNAAYTLLYANHDKRIGHIDFSALATEGAGSDASFASVLDCRLAFKAAAADSHIYGVLETLDAFTPAAGEKFYIELAADQN